MNVCVSTLTIDTMRTKRTVAAGDRFHRWTVIGEHGRNLNRDMIYFCRCQCGTERAVCGSLLKNGKSKSCGCFRSEAASSRFRTHGHAVHGSRSRTYSAWTGMIERCKSPHPNMRSIYRDRGITVCERWKESFEAFLLDMGESPGPTFSLDRINNDKGYAPWNCRWATRRQQERNKRSNRYLEHGGVRMTIAEWAERLQMPHGVLRSRLRYGWDVTMAISAPYKARQFKDRIGKVEGE